MSSSASSRLQERWGRYKLLLSPNLQAASVNSAEGSLAVPIVKPGGRLHNFIKPRCDIDFCSGLREAAVVAHSPAGDDTWLTKRNFRAIIGSPKSFSRDPACLRRAFDYDSMHSSIPLACTQTVKLILSSTSQPSRATSQH